ncbi:hypothetical protein C0J52_08088 [Blattella germanica]|nr:hypothetical protein C0J52_08088 [Blattella germanica]
MGTATKTVFLVLLSLVAVPLATISSKSNNDILPEGDKVKQAKVLELLDQYVLHVDKGRTDDNEQVLDLLDQYVMHVDRGADVSIEELEKRKGSASSHVGWSWNMGQQQLGDQGQEVSNKNDERRRTGVNKIRRINRVRRHLRAVQKNSVSNVLQTKRQLISTRSLQEFKEKERNLNYFEYKTIQNGPVNELNLGSSRFKRNAESRNKGSDKEKESERDLTAGLWTHSVKLDPNVTLSWKVLNESADIEFLVEAATRGYVGVGFSPGGGMAGSDIILGWVDDSTGKIYLVAMLPRPDARQTTITAMQPISVHSTHKQPPRLRKILLH